MPAFFADTFAMPAPGIVTVQEYGSSPRHRHRSVSTKTAGIPRALRKRILAFVALTYAWGMPTVTRARSAHAKAEISSRPSRRPTVEGRGDDVGAADLARRVSESLRLYRAERRMSLDQLAVSSGVSRAALSQIEGARTNPTIGLIWKIAVGLGVPFQALLGTTEVNRSRVLRSGDAIALRSTDGRMESRLLSPSGSADRIEIYELKFQAKGFHRSEPHGAGATETVILLTGALRVTGGDETHDLVAGDTLFFHADVAHSYDNRSSRESRCIDIIAYGRG